MNILLITSKFNTVTLAEWHSTQVRFNRCKDKVVDLFMLGFGILTPDPERLPPPFMLLTL